MNIFVSVGTHPQNFNRLLKAVDELAAKQKKNHFFVQTGNKSEKLLHAKGIEFLSLEDFSHQIKKCDLFITHGGEGNIGQALQLKKPFVMVPRLKQFDEHTNDHQLELCNAIAKTYLVQIVLDINKLSDAMKKAHKNKHERGQVQSIVKQYLLNLEREAL